MRLTVHVHPRSARPAVRWEGSGVEVWVTAPAAGGLANRAVTRALAGWLDVPPSAVRIVRGGSARTKIVDVDGVDRSPEGGASS